jgi:hypothetical protein
MRFARTLDAVSQLSITFRKLPNDLIFAISRPFEGKVAAEEYGLAGTKLWCHNRLRLHEPRDQRCRIGLIADGLRALFGFLSSLLKEFDGNLWRNFFERMANFLGGVRQPVCVNVYSYIAPRAAHGFAQPQVPYRLFEFVPASRALKSDHTCLAAGHHSSSFRCGPRFRGTDGVFSNPDRAFDLCY